MAAYLKLTNGWNAHSRHVKEMLGLNPKAKLPAEGMPGRFIQGIWVYVLSLQEARSGGRFHRVEALCPHCDKAMSAGRLHQHKCPV